MKVLLYSSINPKFEDPHKTTYLVKSFHDYVEICEWMKTCKVVHNLLWVNHDGCAFRVLNNLEWFMLRWL